jgi:hypothetical protein
VSPKLIAAAKGVGGAGIVLGLACAIFFSIGVS